MKRRFEINTARAVDPIEKCAELATENEDLKQLLEKKNAELQKARAEMEGIKAKNQYLDMRVSELDQERHFLGAQLDIVRLIFSGRN